MRIAVFGAGAIGSVLGGRLAAAGRDPVLVARGAQLAALRQDRLRLEGAEGVEQVRVRAEGDPTAVGGCDLVVFTVKAHQLAEAAEAARPLLTTDTVVVTAVNGLPWWYFRGHGGRFEGLRLSTVDPDQRIARALGHHRTVACVVYCAADLVAPGHVRHGRFARFVLGAANSPGRCQLQSVSDALSVPGVEAPITVDIRHEVWMKLWGNAVINPVTALTGTTVGEAAGAPELAPTLRGLFEEVAAVFQALGIATDLTIGSRIAAAARLTGHKSSMLQDIEAGRPPEIDAVVGAVVELAEVLKVPVPRLETVLGCVRCLASKS